MKEVPYRQKIRAEIKMAVDRFHRIETRHHNKIIKKKTFKHAKNYLQKSLSQKTAKDCHVLNFYNILTINETSIRDVNHHQSFIKTHFYYKNLRKIEKSQNFIVAHLGDNNSLTCPISQIIDRYKADRDSRFHSIAVMLQGIEKRLKTNKPQINSSSNIHQLSMKLLMDLGNSAYICKIASQKLVISTSLVEMFGYDTQELIIECLKFRMPLFEGFSCQNYYQVMMKNLQNVNLLMDLLQGTIPYSTFQQLSGYSYVEKIKSKNNIEYTCLMSITMPIPLVSLVKIQKVIKSEQLAQISINKIVERGFRQFFNEIRAKQYGVLQHLLILPDNVLVYNRQKVANYICKEMASQLYLKPVSSTEYK